MNVLISKAGVQKMKEAPDYKVIMIICYDLTTDKMTQSLVADRILSSNLDIFNLRFFTRFFRGVSPDTYYQSSPN